MTEAAAMEDFDEDETGEESVRALVDTARCEICGEVLAQPATTPCGHTFCRECVLSRLEGKGVYASECPRCSMPLRAKDLAPNHAQANVVAAIDALRAFYPVDASVREGDASREPESHTPGEPRESNLVGDTNDDDVDDDRRSKRAKTSPPASPPSPPPTLERCRELARQIRHIDTFAAFIRARLAALKAENAAAKASAAASAAEAAANAAASAAANAAAERSARTTAAVATEPSSARSPPLAESQPGPSQTQTQTQTQPPTQTRRLTMSQARLLFTAAHGSAPPKRLGTLKKLRAELDKLDPSVVAELAPAVLGESTPSGRPKPAPSRVFAFASLRGGDGDPVAAAARAAEMKSRHEMHVRELNARRVDDEFAALAPRKDGPLPDRVTHLLVDTGRARDAGPAWESSRIVRRGRTVRYLEAIARGVWVLHDDYLETSAAAGRWLPEEDFELRDAGRERRRTPEGALGLDRDLDEDEDEHENQTTVSARGGDIASTTSPSRLGPPGGRLRVARGAPGVFAGETVRVLSVSEELLVSEAESLLEAAGARVRRGWGVETRRASRAATRRRRSAPVAHQESEAVPDSQEDEDEDDPDPGVVDSEDDGGLEAVADGEPGIGKGACASARRTRARGTDGGEDTAPLTAVIMARGSSGRAVRDAEKRWRAPALDWHWAYHSVIHNRSLPKEAYFLDGSRAETPASPES